LLHNDQFEFHRSLSICGSGISGTLTKLSVFDLWTTALAAAFLKKEIGNVSTKKLLKDRLKN